MSKRSKTDLIIHNDVREQSSKNCSEIGAYNVLPQSNLKKHKSDSHGWHRREPTRLRPPQCCSGHELTEPNPSLNPSSLLTTEGIRYWWWAPLFFPFSREHKPPAKLSIYKRTHGNCFPSFSLTSFAAAEVLGHCVVFFVWQPAWPLAGWTRAPRRGLYGHPHEISLLASGFSAGFPY